MEFDKVFCFVSFPILPIFVPFLFRCSQRSEFNMDASDGEDGGKTLMEKMQKKNSVGSISSNRNNTSQQVRIAHNRQLLFTLMYLQCCTSQSFDILI
jgi:hypothetical protein